MTTDESRAPLSVVVVGGAGAMGRWTVRWIAKLGSAARLLVADIDVARAERLVGEVGGPCAAVRLDATDPASMRGVFSGNDVVINTMGPFSLFARPILEAAIACGCDYLDIDDDWESTIEGFTLDTRAREAGVRVVKGIGGSPGVSNLCAKLAARRLDSVSEIITGWTMRGAVVEDEPAYLSSSGSAGAAVEHWLIQISGSIRAWRDGTEQEIRPLQPVELDYPGIGRVRTYTVGHPEAVTLPRNMPGVQTSMNVMSGPVAPRTDGAADLDQPVFDCGTGRSARRQVCGLVLDDGAAHRPTGDDLADAVQTTRGQLRTEVGDSRTSADPLDDTHSGLPRTRVESESLDRRLPVVVDVEIVAAALDRRLQDRPSEK